MFNNKFIKAILTLLLVSVGALGQTSFYTDRAVGSFPINSTGVLVPIAYGQVRVCTSADIGTSTSPCPHVANITDINGNPLTIVGGNFGQITTDVVGRFNFGCSLGQNYLIQVAASASNTPQLNYAISCPGVGTNPSISGNLSISGPSPWVDPTAPPYNCKFDDVTDDTACLQSAINATPHSGELRLPAGRTAFIQCASPVNSTCLLIPYPMKFGGTGMNTDQFGSVLRVPSTIANTVDVLRLLGDANGSDGYLLHDFSIQCSPTGQSCARSAVNIDVTSFPIARFTYTRVGQYGAFGSCGLRITNPTPLTNGFFVSDIGPGNIIRNGICGQNIGDSVRIWNNDIPFQSGVAELTQAGIDVTYVPGAQQTTISGNNITQTKGGGIHLGSAARNTYIFDNFFEGGVGATDAGSNGALIDLDGTTSNHVQHASIHDNVIQSITTNINNVRVNFADSTFIYGNTITRPGGTAVDVTVTANASNTMIGWNRWEPTGDTITNILTDAGTGTQYELYGFQSPLGFTLGNRLYVPDGVQGAAPSYAFTNSTQTGFSWLSGAGCVGYTNTTVDVAILCGNRFQLGSGFGYTWGSATAASGAGADTGVSRSAAGVVSADTSTVGNGLGSFKGRAFTSSGTAAGLTGTGACATLSTQTGGSSAGRATCTGTTGASTLTITPGITAPNGWVCYVQDQTTRANLLQQTSTTATACTLTATSVTQNDVVVFSAMAF